MRDGNTFAPTLPAITSVFCNGIVSVLKKKKNCDGHYEGRTRGLGVSRMKAISTTL